MNSKVSGVITKIGLGGAKDTEPEDDTVLSDA